MAQQNWPGEAWVVQWVLQVRSPWRTTAMQTVTFLGSAAVGLGLSMGCSVVLLVRFRRFTRQVGLPLVAILGAAPINFGLRVACGRLRPGVSYIPHHLPELSHPFQRWSYPSGHAMTATICFGMLVYLFLRAIVRVRYVALSLLALWLATIGFSRLYLGVHWPTDVLAGYLAGGAWLSTCLALLDR